MDIWKFIKDHPHIAALGVAFSAFGAASALFDLTERFRASLPALALEEPARSALKAVAQPFTAPFAAVTFVCFVITVIFLVFLPADLGINLANRRDRKELTEKLAHAASKLKEAEIGTAVAHGQLAETQKAMSRTERQNSRLRATVNEATAAHHAIINRLYGADSAPKFDFERLHEKYVFSGEGDAQYSTEVGLRGAGSPAHFWVVWREADASAPGIDLLEDIRLRVESLDTGTDVAILPTESKPHRQEFAIFFLPEIEQNEVRRLKFGFDWPGYAADLFEKGETRLFWSFRSRLPSAETRFSVQLKFKAPFQRVLCRSIGAWNKTSSELKSETHDDGAVWTFTDENLRLHAREYALEIKWLDWPGNDQPPPPPPPPGLV